MQDFATPRDWFDALDADSVASLVATAGDIVLVLDAAGVIRDLAFGSDDLAGALSPTLQGQTWKDAVTIESRPKVEALLREAGGGPGRRWRHVNHPAIGGGPDVPVLYTALQAGHDGPVVAVGRDLRATVALQQRLVEAQLAMERDYARLRHSETRYRLLFQVSGEAVLVVDAATLRVSEANPAALHLLSEATRRVLGRPLQDGFDAAGARTVESLLASVRASGRAEEVAASLADGRVAVRVAASLFRQEGASLFLVRLARVEAAPRRSEAKGPASQLLRLAEAAPDGLVVTDAAGRIESTNPAFLELAQLATPDQAAGEGLERWLGQPGVDLDVLLANLRQHGAIRLFATQMRGEHGATAEVEVSAVTVAHGEQPAFGFTIRNIGRRLARPSAIPGRDQPRSVEQMAELVGRVPLKDLVRESTDLIERMCIEAALELTNDNRANAAEILGLSRQSLYVKLRRYGLGSLGDGEG